MTYWTNDNEELAMAIITRMHTDEENDKLVNDSFNQLCVKTILGLGVDIRAFLTKAFEQYAEAKPEDAMILDQETWEGSGLQELINEVEEND